MTNAPQTVARMTFTPPRHHPAAPHLPIVTAPGPDAGAGHDDTRRSRPTWLVVTRRELIVKLRDKNFLISTALLLAILAVSFGVQFAVSMKSNHVTVAVSSPQAAALVHQAQSDADSANVTATFTIHQVADEAAVRSEITRGKAAVGLLPAGPARWTMVSDSAKNPLASTWLQSAATRQSLVAHAQAAHVDIEQLATSSVVPYTVLNAAKNHAKYVSVMAATAFSMLFFLSALVFGTAIANSVVEEKQNRVVEILASAIPIRHLLIGKVVANTILAIGQMVLLATLAVAGLLATGRGALVHAVLPAAGWFFVFCAVGFAGLATLWAVVGALANRSEDVQSTSAPMMMLTTGVFFAGIIASGTAQTFASFVPLLSTISMPTRIIASPTPWWQIAASLAVDVAGCIATMKFAEGIYRRSAMKTGHKIGLREALHSREQ